MCHPCSGNTSKFPPLPEASCTGVRECWFTPAEVLILFYFYWGFLSLVIKLLLAGGHNIPFRSLLYVLQIGNHHLGAAKFQHFGIEKSWGGVEQRRRADLYFLNEVLHVDREMPPAEAGRGSLFYKEHLEIETYTFLFFNLPELQGNSGWEDRCLIWLQALSIIYSLLLSHKFNATLCWTWAFPRLRLPEHITRYSGLSVG